MKYVKVYLYNYVTLPKLLNAEFVMKGNRKYEIFELQTLRFSNCFLFRIINEGKNGGINKKFPSTDDKFAKSYYVESLTVRIFCRLSGKQNWRTTFKKRVENI